jgi:hypothetical protein
MRGAASCVDPRGHYSNLAALRKLLRTVDLS